MSSPPTPEDYHVLWICALRTEYVVACEFLDEEYPASPHLQHDNHAYTFGRIGHHNVVIGCNPQGKYGLTSAASLAKDMLCSFPSIRFGLMVGIGGGAPSKKHDIRLGDVVVSSPVGRAGGVIQYEFGKTIQNQKFKRTGALDAPPTMLLTALNVITVRHERKGHSIADSVSKMVDRNPRLRKKYGRPDTGGDLLYDASFIHSEPDRSCEEACSASTAQLIQRSERKVDEDDPVVHYGLIASADRLMNDAQARDALARSEDVLCFEMEAAGLMDDFPCLVIRGICDYSDTHNNDVWQSYAAATASAYAIELLDAIPASKMSCIPSTRLLESAKGNTKTADVSFDNSDSQDSQAPVSFGNHKRVSNQAGIQHIYGDINYYRKHPKGRHAGDRPRPRGASREPRGYSGLATEFDEECALAELWPAIPDGEIAKITTTIDIVAVHGLHGQLYQTWTEGSRLWLRDFLPNIVPKARVFTFGYNSALAFQGSASGLQSCAIQLLDTLKSRRIGDDGIQRKIIFICHSLGGLVLKKAFITARERELRYGSISQSIAGVIFLGTPHYGPNAAQWIKLFGRLESMCSDKCQVDLLEALETRSGTLGDTCLQFSRQAEALQIFTIIETVETDIIHDLVVDEKSAILHLPNETCKLVEADHSTLCKFSSASSQTYLMVVDAIIELVDSVVASPNQPGLRSFQSRFLAALQETDAETILKELPTRQGNSCEWLIREQAFLTWRDSSLCRLLWIHGPPGSGKTVVAKHIISYLRTPTDTSFQKDPLPAGSEIDHCYAFFFCDDKDLRRKTSRSLIRSVLHQILKNSRSPQFFRHIEDAVADERDPKIPGSETLWECVCQIIQRSRGIMFWIVLDALDELESIARRETMQGIERVITGDLVGRVKILVTGRNTPKYKYDLGTVLKTLEINMDNQQVHKDVEDFIRAEVEALCEDAILSTQLRGKVEEELLHVSRGTFLHASLALANFSAGTRRWTSEAIREGLTTLQQISPDLESFYCGLLRRIPPQYQDEAREMFEWTLACYEPLTLTQLHCAVCLHQDHQSFSELQEDLSYNFKDKFSEYCGHLLKVEEDGLVRFTHQSVKDLLLGKKCLPANEEVLHFYRARLDDIHLKLAEKCMTMLRLKDFSRSSFHRNIISIEELSQLKVDPARSRLKKCVERYLILEYSIKFWSRHASQVSEDARTVRMVADYISTDNADYLRLISAYWNSEPSQIFPHILAPDIQLVEPPLHHLLQQGDFPEVIQILADSGEDINELDNAGMSPLHWATVRGRGKSLEVLLHIENLDPNRSNPGKDKPIHQSVYWNRTAILKRLLEDERIDINLRGRNGETPLHTAIVNRALDAADTLLLKSKFIDFSAQDNEGRTPLERAFQFGHGENLVTKMTRLIDMELAIKHSSARGLSLLMLAGIWDWSEIEDTIIEENSSQVLSLDDEGMNALTRYAYYGRKDKVTKLLTKIPKSAITMYTSWGRYNLLYLCAQQDWEDIVDILRIKFGLKALGCDHLGRTLLHWAVEYGWAYRQDDYSRQYKSWINKQDRDGSTALHLAVSSRNLEIVYILLSQSADYLLKDKYGKNPVHIAAECGFRGAVELFLTTKTREFGRDHQGAALAHFVAMWLPGDVVRNLIDLKKPLLDVRDRLRRTPLHYAALFNNLPAAAIFLAKGASVDPKDHNLQTPLHYALREGNLGVVKMLVEHGANLKTKDGFMQNCLQISIRGGDMATINFVLQRSPIIHGRDRFGRTALHRACALEDPCVVQKLLSLGADGNSKDVRGYTPLHVAVAQQNRKATESLVRHRGLRVSEKDQRGCTPLDRALMESDKFISDLLIAHRAQNTSDYESKLKVFIPYQGIFHKYAWHEWPIAMLLKHGHNRQSLQETLAIIQTTLGKEHLYTLNCMDNLAETFRLQGKDEQAEELHQQSLELKQTTLGNEHYETLTSMDNLSRVLRERGKYERAEEIQREALRLREMVLGREHPDTLTSMNYLANVLSCKGNHKEAEEIQREALRLREMVLGEEHRDTLTSMNNLADVLSRKGKHKEAEEVHRQALKLREMVLGKKHRDTLTSMNNLANALSREGKHEEAEEMHRQALRLRLKVLGELDYDTWASMDDLGRVLGDEGKHEEAEEIRRRASRLREFSNDGTSDAELLQLLRTPLSI